MSTPADISTGTYRPNLPTPGFVDSSLPFLSRNRALKIGPAGVVSWVTNGITRSATELAPQG